MGRQPLGQTERFGYTPGVLPAAAESAPHGHAPSWTSARRINALAAVYDRHVRRQFASLLVVFGSWSVALFHVGALLLLAQDERGTVLRSIAARALTNLSWVAGLGMALTAQHLITSQRADDPLAALGRMRGFTNQTLNGAVLAARVRLIARTMGLPALAVVLTAVLLARTTGSLLGSIAFGVGSALYVLLVAVVLGGLSHWCSSRSTRRGRGLLLLIVLVPHFLRLAWPDVPSIPAAFQDVLASIRTVVESL